MFRTAITHTPFISDIANEYFSNITGDSFRSDYTFISTMRALLASRMGKDDRITLRFTTSRYTAIDMTGSTTRDCVRAIVADMGLHSGGKFIVHSFMGDDAGNAMSWKVIDEAFTSEHPGYCRLEKMTAFFKKSFQVICFVDPQNKNVVIFTENLDIKKMHYIQMAILPAMPWYFNPDEGLSQLEMDLIQSLKEKSPDRYVEVISAIATQYDFRTLKIKKMLDGFETRFDRIEAENLRNRIASVDREIQRFNNEIAAKYAHRNDYCVKLLGLETRIADGSDDSEIMEYFMCNKKLHIESVSDTNMVFCVSDYLSYFDKEMAERIIDNPRGYVYTAASGSIAPSAMVKLLKAIFIDESLKIRICAAYVFDLRGNVSAYSHYNFPAEFSSYMPNTHIDEYSCMGGYEQAINEILHDGNYIGVIEQCIASCKSLNWGDSTVMNRFIRDLYHQTKSCIELPDGSFVRPSAAIKWIEEKEQEAANGTEKEQEEASHE